MSAILPRVHAILDDFHIAEGHLVWKAQRMAELAGPMLAVHVRSRTLEGRAFLDLARQLTAGLDRYGAWVIVNGRPDVARVIAAPAVVSGRGGLAVADMRHVAPAALVGRSVHDLAEAERAVADGADFLIAGAVYDTPSHPERRPAGLELVAAAAALGKPVIAIGGIAGADVPDVLEAGAWGVAAIRALWDAPDPGAAALHFAEALGAPPTIAVMVNDEERRMRRGGTLADLLRSLEVDPRAVVVEHNRRIVRRDNLAATPVGEGDHIELVHFVGGG